MRIRQDGFSGKTRPAIIGWTSVMAAVLFCVLTAPCRTAEAQAKSPERVQAEAKVLEGMKLQDASDKELQCYLEATRIDPSYSKPLFDLGLVFYDRKEYELAWNYFEQYLGFEPDSLEVTYMFGTCCENLGKTQDAIKYYKKYLDQARSKKNDPAETKYVEFAQAALKRLTPSPQSSESQRILDMLAQNRNMKSPDIVKILSRSRTRGVFKFDGPDFQAPIQFKYDSADILPETHPTLDEIAKALKDGKLEKTRIHVHGHTCQKGGDDYNMDLSRRRAESVRKYLTEHFGVPQDRLDVVAHGKKDPLIKDPKSEEEFEANRRVEVENMGPGIEVVPTGGSLPH